MICDVLPATRARVSRQTDRCRPVHSWAVPYWVTWTTRITACTIDAFDEVFRTEGSKILTTPIRMLVANAFAERWIGSIRRDLLDRTIIWNKPQLERLVAGSAVGRL